MPGNPPFDNPSELELVKSVSHTFLQSFNLNYAHIKINSHVACKTEAKLSAATGRKFLYFDI
jgi:hypothetical protein